MFGCCVAGRLLQTNLTQVEESHAYFELANASTINHVCMFFLGTGKSIRLCFEARISMLMPFPEGYGAAVDFFWPEKGFQLLGM